ncbi:hypothetical protein [Geodermatophilus obscurus]|uniref:hypothetical protein n=1 Tax=Geodermatophilus obscurus TaxID=1861 RepID=UPI001140BF89|nr:hypothetical protein [Geodermatophilus obscurus]
MSSAPHSLQRSAASPPSSPPSLGPARETRRAAAWRPIAATQVAGVLLVAATAVASRVLHAPVAAFTRDVQDLAGIPWFSGAVSTLTVMTWTAVATLALLAAGVVRTGRRRAALFAALAVALTVDDAFLVHEAVGPENGVPQELFLSGYAVLAAVLVVSFLRTPRAGSTVAFLLGLAWLGLSAVADTVLHHRFLLEDGSKLLGALTWLAVPLLTLKDRAPRA